MPSRKKTFRFEANLSEIDAVFIRTAIFLPREVVRQLPSGRVRVKGTFNGAPFSLAVLHKKDGSRYFSVGAPLRKAARIKLGDKVKVICTIVDPDHLDIPEELEAVLAQDAMAKDAWDKLTTGLQRSLIFYVMSVKNVDSRIRRSIDILNKAKAGLLNAQKQKKARRGE